MGKLDSKRLGSATMQAMLVMSICPSPSAEVAVYMSEGAPFVSKRGRSLPHFGHNWLHSRYAPTVREMSKRKCAAQEVVDLGVQHTIYF